MNRTQNNNLQDKGTPLKEVMYILHRIISSGQFQSKIEYCLVRRPMQATLV